MIKRVAWWCLLAAPYAFAALIEGYWETPRTANWLLALCIALAFALGEIDELRRHR